MLFKRFVGCIYRSLRELCTTPECAVLLVSRWTRNTHTFAISRNERKLEHSTQLMTMTYGPKKYHPSSCVAPRRKLTMACGRITNFPSCVARRPLCDLIMTCDHNTTLSSYELLRFALNTCTVLTKSEQMKRSNATEALFSQVNQAAEAFFCITQANHVVHRVLFRFRSMIASFELLQITP